MKKNNKPTEPADGHIEGIFAKVYDKNRHNYILVPVTPNTSIFKRILNLFFGNGEQDRQRP